MSDTTGLSGERMKPGRVQVYTGNGKGKTTAAVGLAIRACGAGLKVFFGQFFKTGDSSEIQLIRKRCPEIHVESFGGGRFVRGKPSDSDIAAARRGLARLHDAVAAGNYDMVVADEANVAVHKGLLDEADLLELIAAAGPGVELVITGRNAAPALLERADLVSEIYSRKHYLRRGTPARKGIEF